MLEDNQPQLSPERIMGSVRGFMESRILLTAIEYDVFTRIEEGARTTGLLTLALTTHLRGTERLLNALVAMGLLTKDSEDRYSNTSEGLRYLVAGSPEYLGPALMHSANLWRTWSDLSEVVRTGKPSPRSLPESRTVEQTEAFIGAMEVFARRTAPLVAEAIDLSGKRRLLDIGCGPATYAIEMCRHHPSLTATVFDLSPVIEIARRNIQSAGMQDRIEMKAGSFLTDEFGEGYDVALLFAILHMNSEWENADLLRKVSRSLVEGGLVIIRDHLMEDSRTRPPGGALFAINMLVNTAAGDSYTETEIRRWLSEAGFDQVRRKEVANGEELLIAAKHSV